MAQNKNFNTQITRILAALSLSATPPGCAVTENPLQADQVPLSQVRTSELDASMMVEPPSLEAPPQEDASTAELSKARSADAALPLEALGAAPSPSLRTKQRPRLLSAGRGIDESLIGGDRVESCPHCLYGVPFETPSQPGLPRTGAGSSSDLVVRLDALPRGPSLRGTTVLRPLRRHNAAVRSCAQRALNKNPDLQGNIVIDIAISGAGRVISTLVVTKTLNDEELEDCLIRTLRAIDFGSSTGEAVENFRTTFQMRGAR